MVMEVALVAGSYLLGSIPFGFIITKVSKGVDIRRTGSGNIGATNVLRVVGKGAALLTFLFDLGKGLFPIVVARRIGVSELSLAAIGLSAVLGHLYPLSLGFRGGKGVATSFGVLLGLLPKVALVLVGLWLIVAVLFRYASLAALAVAFAAPILALGLDGRKELILLAAGLSFLLLLRHRENVKRLLSGQEGKLGTSGR